MTIQYNQVLAIWQDEGGGESTNFLSVQDQTPWSGGPYGALFTAMRDLSRAGNLAVQWSQNLNVVDPAAGGPYSTVKDRLTFVLVTADGRTGQLNLPAPREDIFVAGNVLVDMSNPLVQALVAQVTATLGASDGTPWVEVRQGVRSRIR